MDRVVTGISPTAINALQEYAWPGNVRELAHVIQRAVILSRGTVLDLHELQLNGDRPAQSAARAPAAAAADRDPALFTVPSLNLDEAERALIRQALEATGQNRTHAADLLGIGVRTLRGKLNRPSS
jgi:two-component system response regulator HydG